MGRASLNIAISGDYNGRAIEKAEAAMRSMSVTAAATAGGVAGNLANAGAAAAAMGGSVYNAGQKMENIGTAATKYVTLPIAAAAAACGKAAVDIDTSLTNVRKTVDGTAEQYEQLKDAAIEFSKTNAVSASQILDIQALGAQLGFARDELQEFGEVTSGLDIATNMNAEQAGTEMAQFSNITKMAHGQISNYASAIVGLGNTSATTESDISSMAMRIAAAGTQVGMSQADILGVSAALASMGVEAEAGGTAISTIMANIDKSVAKGSDALKGWADQAGMSTEEFTSAMASNADQFKSLADSAGMTVKELSKEVLDNSDALSTWASTAGMSADEFSAAWKDDPVQALASVFSGMEAATEAGGNMSLMLEDLGIDSIRQTDIMKRLAGNSELVTKSVATANDEWEKNTALQNEVDNRNESMAARFEMLKNKVIAVAESVGKPLVDAALDFVDAAEPVIDIVSDAAETFSNMSEADQKMVVGLVAAAAAFGPVVTVAGKLTKAAGSGITKIGKFNQSLAIFATAAKDGKGKMTGMAASLGDFAGKTTIGTKAATGLAKGLSVASKAVPVLGAAFAVFEIGSFVGSIMRANSEAGKLEAQFWSTSRANEALGESYRAAASKLPEADMLVSASGQTVAELDSVVSTAEQNITGILSSALEEQRQLRQEDIDAINGYNQQIADAYAEKTETYLTLLRTDGDNVKNLVADMTAEEAEAYLGGIAAKGQAALEAESQAFEERKLLLAQQFNAGLMSQDDYNAQTEQAQRDHNDKVRAINGELSDAYNDVGLSLGAASSDVIQAFGNMTASASNTAKGIYNEFGEFTGEFEHFSDNANITKDEFIAAWTGMSDSSINSARTILESAGAVADSGGTMSASMRGAVESIILNFDNLQGEAGEAGKEALLQLVQGLGNEELILQGVDKSTATCDEIVEAMKRNLNLGDVSRDEVNEFLQALQFGADSAGAESELLGLAVPSGVASGIDANSGLPTSALGIMRSAMALELAKGDVTEAAKILGGDIDEGLRQAIIDGKGLPAGAIGTMSQGTIDKAKECWESHSPSQVMYRLGSDINAGLSNGISESSDRPATAMGTLAGLMEDAISELPGFSKATGATSGLNLSSSIGSFAGSVFSSARGLFNSASGGISSTPGAFGGIGSQSGSNLAANLSAYSGAVGGSASMLGSAAVNPLSGLPGATGGYGTDASRRYASGLGGYLRAAQNAGSELYSAGARMQISDAYHWGSEAGHSYANGLMSAVSAAANAAMSIAKAAASAIHFSRPDVGPLRHVDKYGAEMVDVWTGGMVANVSAVRDASLALAQAADLGATKRVIGVAAVTNKGLPAYGQEAAAVLPNIEPGAWQVSRGGTHAALESGDSELSRKLDRMIELLESLDGGMTRKVAAALPSNIKVNEAELFRLGRRAGL